MNPTILYSVLEIIGIVLFSSEGLFVKNIEQCLNIKYE